MTVELVWKNKEYLGKGLVLQRANVSNVKSCSSGSYEKNPDPALKSENGEYVERWRIVHLSEFVENYDEIEMNIENRIGELVTDGE
ncbi:hypothetical protein M199_gp160 [Halogranum tailed virus 1]|uniref:Uncharacterized protein n=1 Tax=Halogranum tailed virus 1 TaxID=1273749 RepID=R4TGV7_9CAUD|nr:hypothetical protein M199_gp160 [Halogranum tailed virus 1]AGM11506.1 hypothetical protein HGTV1_209 [Halogranum tailed virus 1]